jgi:exodeoxyribonuclease V beta subunit
MTSFSGLIKSSVDSHEVQDPADRDIHSTQSIKESSTGTDDLLLPLGKGGATLGDQLHRVLENHLGNRLETEQSIGQTNSKEQWAHVLETILDTRILLPSKTTTTLRSIRHHCITEMHFQLPIARFNPQALSKALLSDESITNSTERTQWTHTLEKTLSQTEFSGFLQGFIDLIFEHEGRWFIADYKSNQLSGYDEANLEEAMLSHKYLLQARLYALALHRHLQVHLQHYDFEQHFGGVVYLFVRAFPNRGVWSERPTLAAINALGAIFTTPTI